MIYLSLGSNLGNRLYNLQCAQNLLKKYGLRNIKSSIILETEAILLDNAPVDWNKPYLNMIISGETDLTPHELLKVLKKIETELGRPIIHKKWAPRLIDLDILLWHDIEINDQNLIIPHPELKNRNFLQHILYLMGVDLWKRYLFPEVFIKSFVLHPVLVGVVNVTHDSFSDGGEFNTPDQAIAQVHKLANDGAGIIEIGAQSTRPGADIQSPEEEYAKLTPVLEGIALLIENEKIKISIDSFWPSVIQKLLQYYKISWINDVKGDFDEKTLRLIAEKGIKFCAMHSLSIPPSRDKILPLDQSAISIIKTWGENKIKYLIKSGFSINNIILDPGVGFGKSYNQNIEILRAVNNLKELGVSIMIGHSRKSYIQLFSSEKAKNRDIETIAISLALKDNIDYLRVHNVRDHMRAFVAHDCFHANF